MLQMIDVMRTWLAAHVDDERGATMVEYGLIVALIAIVVAVGAGALGGAVDGLFQDTANDLPATTPTP